MLIYSCGTSVIVERAGIQGDVTAIEIRFTLVRYEITYYIEGVQQRIWVHESELNHATRKNKVGFKKE